jgi:hypothetical protein
LLREIVMRRCFVAGWSVILLAGFVGPVLAQSIETQSVNVAAESYTIVNEAQGQRASIEGFGSLGVPGQPQLPARIFAIAIPPGAEVVEVTYGGAAVVLPGKYDIVPAALPRVIGDEDPLIAAAERQRYEENHAAVYGCDDVFPARPVELVRTAGYREYNLVDVRVTPLAYRPASGVLTHYPCITVQVRYRMPATARDVVVNSSRRIDRVARDIVLNYDEAQTWYRADRQQRGLHDFVIITLDSLTSAVAPLVNWETTKGRTVQVVTTAWINTNYTGYDLAAKMRAFLRDKYPAGQWGIEDVLLVGNRASLPMRRTAQDIGYGKPETDFYYAELSLPDNQSWDSDGDHLWGENTDPIDFYNEVNVGRIPWSDAATVLSICNKSVAFEQNTDPNFKKNMLLLGGFFWEDTDNAVLMETKISPPWMADWTVTRMYEYNSTVQSTYLFDYELTHSNVLTVWPGGTYAFVNWAGHGSPTSAHIMGYGTDAFIQSSDCALLSNSEPAIIFADACSNSDTDYTNIGQSMLQRGAVGFVGATKVALGMPGWNGPYAGSSQSLDYFFTTYVTSGEYTQGAALQAALREMYTHGMWGYVRYETFEWGALWGNPALALSSPARVGDLNCDGVVDFNDINPFVLYLSNFSAWQAAYPTCPAINGDIDGDGTYPSMADINPFVALLVPG